MIVIEMFVMLLYCTYGNSVVVRVMCCCQEKEITGLVAVLCCVVRERRRSMEHGSAHKTQTR
jgi:hypothetical protein